MAYSGPRKLYHGENSHFGCNNWAPMRGCGMKKSPRVHSPAFKAQVAFAALKGDQTINQVAAQFGVRVKLVQTWKKQMTEEAATLFAGPAQASELKQQQEQQAEL